MVSTPFCRKARLPSALSFASISQVKEHPKSEHGNPAGPCRTGPGAVGFWSRGGGRARPLRALRARRQLGGSSGLWGRHTGTQILAHRDLGPRTDPRSGQTEGRSWETGPCGIIHMGVGTTAPPAAAGTGVLAADPVETQRMEGRRAPGPWRPKVMQLVHLEERNRGPGWRSQPAPGCSTAGRPSATEPVTEPTGLASEGGAGGGERLWSGRARGQCPALKDVASGKHAWLSL